MYVKYMLYVGQDSLRTPVRTGVLKEFMEAMLCAYNVHVVVGQDSFGTYVLTGVLSRKKMRLYYMHTMYMLYIEQRDSFRTLVRRNRSSEGVLSERN